MGGYAEQGWADAGWAEEGWADQPGDPGGGDPGGGSGTFQNLFFDKMLSGGFAHLSGGVA